MTHNNSYNNEEYYIDKLNVETVIDKYNNICISMKAGVTEIIITKEQTLALAKFIKRVYGDAE